MNTVTSLLFTTLFSLMIGINSPKHPAMKGVKTTHETTKSTICEENCQLPSKPDDDEDDD